MGVNKKNIGKSKATYPVDIEELRSCMRCQYFYGNNHQCILNNCIEEPKKEQAEATNSKKGCPCTFKISDGYCFPCMKDLLKLKK